MSADAATDSDTDEPPGTAILADEPHQRLRWHYSVAFDGAAGEHETACDRTIDCDDVRDVELDPRTLRTEVPPVDRCTLCSKSLRERGPT